MHPEGFEPAIPISERLQTHAFSRAATGIGRGLNYSALTRHPCYKYSQQPVSLAFRMNDYIDECATNTGSCRFVYLAFRKNNYNESTS
jgi:hypothetical protein